MEKEKEVVSPCTEKKDRIPPGQREVSELPVLDLGKISGIKKEEWKLEISGLVEKELSLTYAELLKLPKCLLKTDIHCVTTWSVLNTVWKGAALSSVLPLCKPSPKALFVTAFSFDGYSTNFPAEYLFKQDSILAYEYENEPLPFRYGGPVRLLIPSLYFWKSAKWLKKIEFMEKDSPGYWEQRGYHMRGDPWAEERYGG